MKFDMKGKLMEKNMETRTQHGSESPFFYVGLARVMKNNNFCLYGSGQVRQVKQVGL